MIPEQNMGSHSQNQMPKTSYYTPVNDSGYVKRQKQQSLKFYRNFYVANLTGR